MVSRLVCSTCQGKTKKSRLSSKKPLKGLEQKTDFQAEPSTERSFLGASLGLFGLQIEPVPNLVESGWRLMLFQYCSL